MSALSKLYGRTPTNEDIERDFSSALYDAWLELTNLYDFLEVLNKDGVLYSQCTSVERLLEDLAETRDRLSEEQVCDFFGLDFSAAYEAPKPETKTRLKRPRGALRRAIVAGLVSTDEAHKQGYMGKAEMEA